MMAFNLASHPLLKGMSSQIRVYIRRDAINLGAGHEVWVWSLRIRDEPTCWGELR